MKKKKQKLRQTEPQEAPQREEAPIIRSGYVQIGDVVLRRPLTFSDSDAKNSNPLRGTVVWIHPQGRFHMVEFEKGIRESFAGVKR